jgi:zinc protease
MRGACVTKLFEEASVHRRTLSNGLTALVREDHSAPVVAIVTYLKVGYFDEPDELAGISHVLEHMFFKGTESRGPGEIGRETKAAGGLLNAATIYDHTSYYTVLPASSLETGLALQSDALINSVIDADELRRELQVIIQEAKRKLDNPSALASESLYELMFDRHRMRRWRIGTEDFLRQLTREQLCGYYRSMYRGASTVLAIAGDVDADRTHELIEQYYAPLAAGTVPRDRGPHEPERHDFRLREHDGDIVQQYAEVGWRTVPVLHADTPTLDLVSLLLGQGRASRLYRNVREAGLVTSIGARNYTPTELGVFQISAELQPENTLAALEATMGSIAGMIEAVSAEELERAQSLVESRAIRRVESMEGQANVLAEWEALGDWRLGEEYLERIARINLDDVRKVATQYLPSDAASIFLYRPKEASALGLDPQAVQARLQHRAALRGDTEVARTNGKPTAARTVKRVGVEDEVHEFSTDTGIRIVVKPRRSMPLVALAIGSSGGMNQETESTAGLTGLAARTSIKGTRTRSAARLAVEAEALGSALSPSVSPDLFDWYITVPTRHFERAFELVADAALEPTFPEAELEREKQVALADLEQVRDDMYRYPLRLFLQTAYSGHAYGFPLETTEVSTAAASSESVRAWHAKTLRDASPRVFIVGDVDPEAAAQTAARFLDTRAAALESAAAPTWSNQREIVETREKAQTALLLGFPAVDRNHPDLVALQLLSNAIGGLGGRLFEELRSRRSLAYTVSVYPVARQLAGAFVGYIATSPEREDEARNSLLEELEKIRQERLSDEELERAKRYTIGTWHIRSQTNAAQLGDLMNALLIGEGLREIREYEERVRAVTTEQIREVAERYFDQERMVQAVVRGTGAGR